MAVGVGGVVGAEEMDVLDIWDLCEARVGVALTVVLILYLGGCSMAEVNAREGGDGGIAIA